MTKVIHIVAELEVVTELFLKSKILHFENLTPLPKDAQIIHFEYDDKAKRVHLFFVSEKGYSFKEGQILSSIPATDIVLKDIRTKEECEKTHKTKLNMKDWDNPNVKIQKIEKA